MKMDCLGWAEKSGVLGQAKTHLPAFSHIVSDILKPKGEKILVITDYGRGENRIAPIMGFGYFLAARKLGLDAGIIMQKEKTGIEDAEEHISRGLGALESSSIIILSKSNKLGNLTHLRRSFRGFVQEGCHRFISGVGLGSMKNSDLGTVLRSMDIDYVGLRRRQRALKKVLDRGKEVWVRTPAGTDFFLDIKKRTAISNDGRFHSIGTGGNIPCGEVYIANNKRIGEGRIVIDGSSRNCWGTEVVRRPIEVIIEDGEVSSIEGGSEAKLLRRSLDMLVKKAEYPWGIKLVGEFGIGCNPNASIIGSMIVDEKAVSTGHIAFGSNYWFGGRIKAISHLDQVFRDPEIFVDGEHIEDLLGEN